MSTMAVSCGAVGRSSLNPNAPLFVPMLFQEVEDFSPEWWELVQTTPWFRDHWFHLYQEQEMFDGEDSFDFGLTELPIPDTDLNGASNTNTEQVEMDKAISEATKKHDKHLDFKAFDALIAASLNLSAKSLKNGHARPLSVPEKHRDKPVQCVSPKFNPRRIIHQPR